MPYADPAARKAFAKRSYAAKREEVKAARRARHERQRAAENATEKARREADREHYRALARAGYRRRNPTIQRVTCHTPEERRARVRQRKQARRARERDQFVEQVDPHIVFERDEGICGICHCAVDVADYHVDHVIPLARGGEHSYANVQVAHPTCNRRKGAR
jgi:5-methylcytosine-specific restriction endonuclease McrA